MAMNKCASCADLKKRAEKAEKKCADLMVEINRLRAEETEARNECRRLQVLLWGVIYPAAPQGE